MSGAPDPSVQDGEADLQPSSLKIGGRYRVVRCLGQGGMGTVYEAIDEETRTRVAVKVVAADVSRDETAIGRFEREARATAHFDTPHIVRVLDAGTDPKIASPYLVMEYLEGEDLHHLSKRLGPLPPRLAAAVASQACRALEVAHANHIVHRDIKPANLFLTRGPGDAHVVKLLDFGIAKIRSDPQRSSGQTAGLTRTGSVLGSPLYMSPEQARGHKDIDVRSDIWSLGVVMYQALAGRTPHADTDQLGELIVLICTEAPPPISEIAPWVPAELAVIVHKALQFRRNDRFASAAEMREALSHLLPEGDAIAGSIVRAHPVTWPEGERSGAPSGSSADAGGSESRAGRSPADDTWARAEAPTIAVARRAGSAASGEVAAPKQATTGQGPSERLPISGQGPSSEAGAHPQAPSHGPSGSTVGGAVWLAPSAPAAKQGSLSRSWAVLGAIVALGIGGALAFGLTRGGAPPTLPVTSAAPGTGTAPAKIAPPEVSSAASAGTTTLPPSAPTATATATGAASAGHPAIPGKGAKPSAPEKTAEPRATATAILRENR